MVKKIRITLSLIPEASKVSNEKLKTEIEEQIKETLNRYGALWNIPWVNQLDSIEIIDEKQGVV
jgi:hypothetical protein